MAAERVIQVNEYRCWFSVEVNDADLLEFVLMEAAQRAGKESLWYVCELWDMLNDEFSGDDTTKIVSQESFGKVSFELSYERSSDLPKILKRCCSVVKNWAARYNVNQMKRD